MRFDASVGQHPADKLKMQRDLAVAEAGELRCRFRQIRIWLQLPPDCDPAEIVSAVQFQGAENNRMREALKFISGCENLKEARQAALQAGICASIGPRHPA